MKSMVALFCLLVLISPAKAQLRSDRDLQGVWEGDRIHVEFSNNGKSLLILPGEPKHEGTYKIDLFAKPARLELRFSDKGTVVTIRCIIELTDSNTLKWEAFDRGDYPAAFTPGAYTLKRKR